ncbi:hypothetical protein [Gemmata sp.]|uniref:hypothetical protein n=1 Tax=Gemmata sp. TaxID=1914242 RepID=UPI003F72FBCB
MNGLYEGARDRGVAHVVFLIARSAAATYQKGFSDRLAGLGVFVPNDPGLFEFTAALVAAMRNWYQANRGTHTDLSKMAVLAGAEAVTQIVGDRAAGLFPSGGEVHRAVGDFATRTGFAHLAHQFFGRFVRRFLLYHLSRELSQHVGGNGRFADAAAHTAFLSELGAHCEEAALIVKVFSGRWYDRHRVEEGITEAQARGFCLHCLRDKLAPELTRRGGAP